MLEQFLSAFPSGRTSCTSDLECQIFPGTVCRDAMCKCPRVTLHYACGKPRVLGPPSGSHYYSGFSGRMPSELYTDSG